MNPGRNTIPWIYRKKYFVDCVTPRSMAGNSGKGRHGEIHWYYSCGERRRHHICTKKNEQKGFIDWYVVEQTAEYVLTPERMEYFAEALVKEYDNEFDTRKLADLEKRIEKHGRDINKFTDLLLEDPAASWKHIYQRIEDTAAMVNESSIIPSIPEEIEGSTSDPQSGRKGTRTPGPLVCDTSALTN